MTPQRSCLQQCWDVLNSPKGRRRLKRVGVLACFGAIAAIVATFVPIKAGLDLVCNFVRKHQYWGMILHPIMICIAIPLAIPVTVLEILAGSVFGMMYGVPLNIIGKTCGAMITFRLGKRLGKKRLAAYLHGRFRAFAALSTIMEGPNWKPVLLIHLSQLPPWVKCYGLSITKICFLRFSITAFIGGIPNAILWAYVGKQTHELINTEVEEEGHRKRHSSSSEWISIGIGLGATVLAMIGLVYYTKRELKTHLEAAAKQDTNKSEPSMANIDEVATALATGDDIDIQSNVPSFPSDEEELPPTTEKTTITPTKSFSLIQTLQSILEGQNIRRAVVVPLNN